MNLTLERDALHAALGRVARIVERRTTIPILAHLHLAAGEGGLAIRGTDLDMEAATRVAAAVRTPGTTTVPANLLAEIVARHPSGAQVGLAVETSGAGHPVLVVRAGRSRVTLNVLPAEDFPDVGPQEAAHTFTIEPAALAAMIGKTEFAISTEETRYYLGGIYFHAVAGEDGAASLRAVATDGHRLARMAMPAPAGAEALPGMIVPRKAVAELKRLVKDAAGPVTLAVNDRRLVATVPGKVAETVLSTKLIDGTFPDYARVIPTGNRRRAVLDRAAGIAAAERVACISSERGRAVKLAFADDRLVFAVRASDAGDAADEIDVDYADAPLEIAFNAAYFGECLGTFDSERVRIDLEEAGSPTVLRAEGADDLLIVLMPTRVS